MCLEAYFSGDKRLPTLSPCNHVFCNGCLAALQKRTLARQHPSYSIGHAPLSDTCEKCITWAGTYKQMVPTRVVAMIEPKYMLDPLKEYVTS
jgi:hypothetical protein